jgi:serine/threonine protein kinase
LIEKHALQATSASSVVITLLGTYQDKNFIYFLADFVQGENLMGYMIKRDILTHDECVFFIANIVSGLEYLNSKGFVHRDVKPENVSLAVMDI